MSFFIGGVYVYDSLMSPCFFHHKMQEHPVPSKDISIFHHYGAWGVRNKVGTTRNFKKKERSQRTIQVFLVGGFNPYEKYAREIGSFPEGSGWKFQKICQLPPATIYVHQMCHFWSRQPHPTNLVTNKQQPFCRLVASKRYHFPLVGLFSLSRVVSHHAFFKNWDQRTESWWWW